MPDIKPTVAQCKSRKEPVISMRNLSFLPFPPLLSFPNPKSKSSTSSSIEELHPPSPNRASRAPACSCSASFLFCSCYPIVQPSASCRRWGGRLIRVGGRTVVRSRWSRYTAIPRRSQRTGSRCRNTPSRSCTSCQ